MKLGTLMMQYWLLIFLAISMPVQAIKDKNSKPSDQKFILTSPAFTHNGFIPARNACDGENLSPALQWQNAPAGTKSFALIVDDPDATEKKWVHWLLFNIPVATTSLEEGIQHGDFVSGENDFYYMKNGIWQYGGPCPPSLHHYHFTLYALDIMLNLPADTGKEDLLQAMKNHILGQTTLIGLYERKK